MIVLLLTLAVLNFKFTIASHDDLNKPIFDLKSIILPRTNPFTGTANIARKYDNIGFAPLNRNARKYRLQFAIDPLPEHEVIKAAEVRFTMLQNTDDEERVFNVSVHDIVQPGIKGQLKPVIRQVDSKLITASSSSKSKVVSFDVTSVVERLSKEERFKRNYGIIVQSMTDTGKRTRIIELFDFESINMPVLIIYTYNNGSADKQRDWPSELAWRPEWLLDRAKRMSGVGEQAVAANNERWNEGPCRLHPMRVEFAELGWSDWMFGPTGYDAYRCGGRCDLPLADHMNASDHAVVQALYHHWNPAAAPEPCCVPIKLGPLTAFAWEPEDTGPIRVRTYEKMVAEECGCR